MKPTSSTEIEFQAVVHDGILDVPAEHRHVLDGRTVRVILVDVEPQATGGRNTIFARLRRVKTHGPTDLLTHHDDYVLGEPDA